MTDFNYEIDIPNSANDVRKSSKEEASAPNSFEDLLSKHVEKKRAFDSSHRQGPDTENKGKWGEVLKCKDDKEKWGKVTKCRDEGRRRGNGNYRNGGRRYDGRYNNRKRYRRGGGYSENNYWHWDYSLVTEDLTIE